MKNALIVFVLLTLGGILLYSWPAPKAPAENPAEPEVPLSSYAIFIHDEVSVPVDSRRVDLSGRGLNGSLKAEIRQLTELRELDLAHNNFTGLPAEVGQLSKLEVLNLSDNPLTGLPHELGNLQNLKTLDLRGTQYSTYDLNVIQAALPSEVEILTDQ
ncbi:MAG: leucine-rich repeat domain-containing protein [Candidatus Kaiserbacteria bacterium]|nr:leucine-rich repeat domain-containing protein [Candidatus Kaiserbacteria bacterium]MCB9815910.1 leucine-rich repeat domain-containing protein [Candidatus Nomurabacteria bacterium]